MNFKHMCNHSVNWLRPAAAGLALTALCQSGLASEEAQSHSEGHHDFKRHMVGVFVGAEHEDSRDELSYGLEYEYRFTQTIGAGVIYEEVPDAHHGDGTSVYLAALSVHPYAEWRLIAAVGEERIHGPHKRTETLYRVGAGYDFHVGKNFGIEPTIAIDRADGEYKTVYGILFNYKF